MVIEQYSGGSSGATSLVDVLDRVLDKGIVIDAWVRVSLVGIDLLSVEARVVVASIDTYLRYAEAIGLSSPVARSGVTAPTEQRAVGGPSDAVAPEVTQQSQSRPRATARAKQTE